MNEGTQPDGRHGAPAPALTEAERTRLLDVAREALTRYVLSGDRLRFETDSTALRRPQATFVTVRQRETGDLRGCRGEIEAVRPLIESVAGMAIAAGTDDARFASVTSDELDRIHYEINALSPFARIEPRDVVLGRHGLMIDLGGRRGLLLPNTPHLYGWDRSAYLQALCRKASLPDDAWRSESATLWGFETESWAEDASRKC